MIAHDDSNVEKAGEEIADVLGGLEYMFEDGMLLAFIAFDPNDGEKDLCITSGKSSDLLAAIKRVYDRENNGCRPSSRNSAPKNNS